jgi:uncharacterized protein (DUF934 family)
MPLIKNAAVADDPWTALHDEADAPASGDVIVSYARVIEEAPALLQRDGRLGVRVAPHEDVAALDLHLDAIALIALEFPRYTDGRAYSSARLLRERYGFDGELRAVGDVLRDQLFFMARCGFDAFEIDRPDAADAFAAAMAELRHVYQPASDGRRAVWRRRGADARASGVAAAAE